METQATDAKQTAKAVVDAELGKGSLFTKGHQSTFKI